MKKIKIIVPVNNKEMLNEQDLLPYQSKECQFYLDYPDTTLKQLNKKEDAEKVWPLLLKMIEETANEKANVLIMYAFGDCAIKEAQEKLTIPVLGLGRVVVPIASALARKKFSIIPGHLAHNNFIGDLVTSLNLNHNFIPSSVDINMDPQDVKTAPEVLERLINASSVMIENHGVDAFTFGCGTIVGYAEPLQKILREKYQTAVTVVDPLSVPLNIAKLL